MQFPNRMLKRIAVFRVLSILFALFIAAYCNNDIKYIDIDFAHSNISLQNSQDKSSLGDNGKNVFYFISTPQFQFSDSSSKNRKSDCGKGFARNFKINHQIYIIDLPTSGFVSTFQSRFRKTCPSECGLSAFFFNICNRSNNS